MTSIAVQLLSPKAFITSLPLTRIRGIIKVQTIEDSLELLVLKGFLLPITVMIGCAK